MLDSQGKRWIQPFLEAIALRMARWGWTPNGVTILALAFGLIAAGLYALGFPGWSIFFLWMSGLCDAIDGTLARCTQRMSAWGTLLDVTFDRIVEIAILIVIAWHHREHALGVLVLMGTFVIAMTVFLTVGALSAKQGNKSFYYQPGVIERTEGFVLLTLMIAFPLFLQPIILLFLILEVITIGQRLREAHRLLK